MPSKPDLLERIRQKILAEMICPLKDGAKNLVFGKGNCDAQILFIGEAPGEQEDLQGIPFVGAAGRELDKLLRSIGLTLEDCYIANILKYRPPNNRAPAFDEIQRHTPYLIEQIKIIQPKIIAPLGNFATKFILARGDCEGMKKIGGISFLHGKPRDVDLFDMKVRVVPLYHPAAMLHNPRLRADLEQDMQIIRTLITENGIFQHAAKTDFI